jgi:membrane-bound metal-dependent hydrolase YbcI (DUF457 family)
VDLFTHILVAYLVTFGIVGFQPSYLAAGALAGGLPDADALFFPIARRFPILRHHGITHSLTGITIIAVAGAFLAPMLAPGSPWIYFLVMWVGGLCHVLQDAFTNFSVPPFLPWSKIEVHLDADRAINFLTLIFSVASFYLLLGVERNHVPFAWYLVTVYALMAFFAAYFAIRIAGRLRVGARGKAIGDYHAVVPTGNPFNWVLLKEQVADGRVRTTWTRYRFGKGVVDGPNSVEVPIQAPAHTGAPSSADEALSWSYALARAANEMIASTYHFGEAFRSAAGDWVAEWYSLEFTALGRSSGVRVRFPADGAAPEVKSAFLRPRHPAF